MAGIAGDRLRLHAFEPRSAANGPGVRAVVWVQGCTFACPGCFNPETHGRAAEGTAVDGLFDRIAALGDVEGVTVSGGEPLQQRGPVLALLRRIRTETALSSVVFTGYRWEEFERMPEAAALRECVDVLLAGRYERDRHLGAGLRGSGNKTVHLLSDRYTREDLEAVPRSEVIIRDGRITVTGIDPAVLGPAIFGSAAPDGRSFGGRRTP
ncbi:4Fe-4S single cluster domain-containing protein [Glycomyces buryatensis]|nr:4Fe-4S single cluster domain-containing protein [Glycomyces buryatensis]